MVRSLISQNAVIAVYAPLSVIAEILELGAILEVKDFS